MTDERDSFVEDSDLRKVVMQLNERVLHVEKQLGISPPVHKAIEPEPVPAEMESTQSGDQETLEFEVGQTWFALIGIVVLAIGMAFLLSLPFASLPGWLPSIGGYLVCGVVFVVAKISAKSFQDISKYLRGAGMLLLFFATWRLFDFSPEPALSGGSLTGRLLLILVVVTNVVLAWRRNSQILFTISMITGMAACLVGEGNWFPLVGISALVALAGFVQVKLEWRSIAPVTFVLAIIAYILWAIGNPLVSDELAISSEFYMMVWAIPVWVTLVSVTIMLRPDTTVEDGPVQVSDLLLCGFGFGLFFLHHLIAFDQQLLFSHLAMALIYLLLSMVFWVREQSRISTFFFAMTGYMALSFALIKAFEGTEMFVALSLQSLVVIATAVYFSSPFIIVANCLIFIGIIGGYIFVTDVEKGMSIGFGVVALISARILNWQKERLVLKTELMRNTYLLIAFLILPYALYFLVPEGYAAVALVGLALFYYGLHLTLGNRKYRWMGHATLLLTALYTVLIGTAQLDSHYRIITFLILGSIMLIVSLIFTMRRAKRTKSIESGKED